MCISTGRSYQRYAQAAGSSSSHALGGNLRLVSTLQEVQLPDSKRHAGARHAGGALQPLVAGEVLLVQPLQHTDLYRDVRKNI